MDTTEIESKWTSEGYADERISQPAHLTTQPHSHPFDARVCILGGEFTLTSQGQSRVFYPGEHFAMPAGCLHGEHYGPEGAVLLIGRKPHTVGVRGDARYPLVTHRSPFLGVMIYVTVQPVKT